MKAAPFHFHQPATLAELAGLLTSLSNARILAGGQSLVAMLNLRLVTPDHLVDINKIADLATLRQTGGTIEIGAMVRQHTLLHAPLIAQHLPVLVEALGHVGHMQTRSRGTIGGSCCHLDPSAELPAMCALLDAAFTVNGARGRRIVPASDWFAGLMQAALAEDEFLESISITPWSGKHGYGFAEYARRHGDYAIVGAGALLEADGEGTIKRAALVLFGCDTAPQRLPQAEAALVGTRAANIDFAGLAAAARAQEMMSDAQVTAAYRARLAGIMMHRAVKAAQGRLNKERP
ncbi:MAG: FAD binding domain-containing protein [Hyphomicrobiales bacterium]|nr:FAD binding domain-containing protein [Hyphomicrobiales bacterium]